MIKSLKAPELGAIAGAQYHCYCRKQNGHFIEVESLPNSKHFVFIFAHKACLKACCSSSNNRFVLTSLARSPNPYLRLLSRLSSGSPTDDFDEQLIGGAMLDTSEEDFGFYERPYSFNCDEELSI